MKRSEAFTAGLDKAGSHSNVWSSVVEPSAMLR